MKRCARLCIEEDVLDIMYARCCYCPHHRKLFHQALYIHALTSRTGWKPIL